jgi:hypothetical protein
MKLVYVCVCISSAQLGAYFLQITHWDVAANKCLRFIDNAHPPGFGVLNIKVHVQSLTNISPLIGSHADTCFYDSTMPNGTA